jgi:alpha-tubulin suppressor-like RCC1 family protein
MKVLQVSCGENHSLALVEMSSSEERKIFVWGNNDKMQLGMDNGNIMNNSVSGGEEGSSPPVNHEDSAQREINVPHQMDPDPFNDDENDIKTVTKVYASYYYSAAVT